MFILCHPYKGKKQTKILLYSAAVALAAWLVFYVVIRTPFPFPRFISIWS
jgi:hypothetical protein